MDFCSKAVQIHCSAFFNSAIVLGIAVFVAIASHKDVG